MKKIRKGNFVSFFFTSLRSLFMSFVTRGEDGNFFERRNGMIKITTRLFMSHQKISSLFIINFEFFTAENYFESCKLCFNNNSQQRKFSDENEQLKCLQEILLHSTSLFFLVSEEKFFYFHLLLSLPSWEIIFIFFFFIFLLYWTTKSFPSVKTCSERGESGRWRRKNFKLPIVSCK